MRIARAKLPDGSITHGCLRDESFFPITGDILRQWKEIGNSFPAAQVKLLAPVEPPNILCIGRNYKAHAEEGGADLPEKPLLFIKATSCLANPEDPVVIPAVAPKRVDYEAELVVVLKKAARHVSETEALQHVLGYTCGHDVSARDCQNGDGQWARGKSFDTFGPIGPWIETDLDPSDIRITGRLNGKVMQQARTSLLIFSVPYLISYLSRSMTLLPGTVLFTGTPAGCGFAQEPPVWLQPGDTYEVEIEGIGTLRNSFVKE
ncbi:MAG: fumarylacetoacetate hydrolase family protein [Phycisphaerae bacterium]|nr:fumarylacetoacetate hydrolase family protein [Phycisphaerae bacterium]